MNREKRRMLEKQIKKARKEGVKMDEKDQMIQHMQQIINQQSVEIGNARTEIISLRLKIQEKENNLQIVSKGYMELKDQLGVEENVSDGQTEPNAGGEGTDK